MAGPEGSLPSHRLEANCYETALCIIPPLEYCREVDRLRELYDKGYGRWPAHINLMYPFVSVDLLPRAKEVLQSRLAGAGDMRVRLGGAGSFTHRQGHTIFAAQESVSSEGGLEHVRTAALDALGLPQTPCEFHLTVGQSADQSDAARDYLMDKASRLPSCEFRVESVAILVRERTSVQDKSTSEMRLWDTISLLQDSNATPSPVTEFWTKDVPKMMSEEDEGRLIFDEQGLIELDSSHAVERPETTYSFNPDSGYWAPYQPDASRKADFMPKTLRIATYNVLADPEHGLPRDRGSSLLQILSSSAAVADVLILEEVTDDFLTQLLSDEDILEHYTFSSHGPSSQPEVGPLPSLRNIVILSRLPFSCSWLRFQRRHKGALIATFCDFGLEQESTFQPMVVAGIHLTSGLTDGSVAAKTIQISRLLNFLEENYASSPWVIAGDFNITTSTSTIHLAIKDKSISQQTAKVLTSIESNLAEAALLDSWSVARIRAGDDSTHSITASEHVDVFEGEEGATFDPRENALAAGTSGTSKNRPQRYDRILVKGAELLMPSQFNMFGHADFEQDGNEPALAHPVPSDHYGIRAVMTVHGGTETTMDRPELLKLPELHVKSAPSSLLDGSVLTTTLTIHGMFPTDQEVEERKLAFDFLKSVLSGTLDDEEVTPSHVLLTVVPVGSYALKVWNKASDIDCLCIGNISSKVFFKLARQRIRKAATQGIRIIRKVEASSGTLLELSVKGIYADLHYCPATRVVERWSTLGQLSQTDPFVDLPILSLRKLKPYRDLDYIQRTLPNTAAFQLAYRCIKLWAVQNGLYSSRFGYLGGIHITLMVSLICKRMAHQTGAASAEDIVATFFHYYANFDWKNDMVYDPFFHKSQPRYQRSSREPMAILGLHVPNANVAHTSTLSGLEVLVKELKAADRRLSEPSVSWEKFFGSRGDVESQHNSPQFLDACDNYVRIDIQYWGRTQSNGRKFVGWLESRCLVLVVDIKRILPNFEVRIWPARFASTAESGEKDYQGCYLIGLSRNADAEAAPSKPDRAATKDSLLTSLGRFERQIQEDDRYYDSSSCWVGVSLVKKAKLGALQLDRRDWGDPAEEDDGGSSDDEEEEAGEDGEDGDLVCQLSARKGPRESVQQAKKLRPASDILNRLRWDPSLDLADYIVGYEDRFLGAKETMLERWKTEQTDEEFIPQHRILYFKRRSDGQVMWERRTRVDRIFGSGISGGDTNA